MKRILPIVFVLLLMLASSRAHNIFLNSARIEYDEDELQLTVQVSAREICAVHGIPIDGEGNVEKARVEEAATRHQDYFFEHFKIFADGQELRGVVKKIRPPLAWENAKDGVDRSFFEFNIHYAMAKPASHLRLWQNMMSGLPYDEGTPFTFSYTLRFNRLGKVSNDFGNLAFNGLYDYATGMGEGAGAAADENRRESMHSFLSGGISHVLTGYDHLLFASALILALRGFWDIFKVIGLFTLAHSITVTLAAYKLLPEMGWVERAISASIVIVALENIFFPNSARSKWRLWMVFGLGLIHGMGLAGHFVESLTGLDGGAIALAIVLFCVGVEVGHLCVVGPLSLVLAAGRTWLGGEKFGRASMLYGSAFVALAGLYFFASQMHWVPEDYRPDKVFGAG